MLKSRKKHILELRSVPFIYLTAFLLVIVDQISKTLFTNKSFFENALISINYTQNMGSAFGLFSNITYYNIFIILLSLIVLAVVFYQFKYFIKSSITTLTLIFFSAGIIGNLIDRIFFGFVRDFIAIKYLFIFNLADFYLTVAVILILWNEIFEKKN